MVPAGPADAVERVKPFLAAHGRLLPTQDAAQKANVMKLIGNFTLFGFVHAMCEVSNTEPLVGACPAVQNHACAAVAADMQTAM